MKNKARRLVLTLLALALALGAGWGTYTFAGPSTGPGKSSGHEGHDHGSAEKKGSDAHAHAEEGHAEEGHGEHGEELEDLFGTEEGGARETDHRKESGGDPHAGHDHPESSTSAAADPHAGHQHGGANEICPEHGLPEVEDALCRGDHLGDLHPGEGMKVRLSSKEAAGRAGIAVAHPSPAGEGGLSWPGQVVFNRDRVARLSSLASGTVKTVRVDLGQQVKEGAVLAEIASPEASALNSSLQMSQSRRDLAQGVFQREKDLLERGITSMQEFQQAQADLRQAESALEQARQQSRDYGVTPGGRGSTLSIRAPFSGTVVERLAIPGEAVSPGGTLFTIADLSRMWVEVSIPSDALQLARPGLPVSLSFSGLPGRSFAGKIFWVAPALDERTRMIKALAEVDNREGILRSGLFGQVFPSQGRDSAMVAIPADALQSVDGNPFVFLRLEDDLYEIRRVAAGRRAAGTVTITDGLSMDDRVVVAQAFALKSEVLKARLGASCADH